MDPRIWTADDAEKAKTGRHGDSDTGEIESSSKVGRIPPGKHGVRRLRRSRSLPPTSDHDAGASGRTTNDGTGAAASTMTFQTLDAEELCGLLVPLVLLAPNCPWCSTDQPMAMISWISLLFCLYLFFLITSLSAAMGAAQVFLRVSYLVVLGWLVGYAVSPFMGMIVLYSNTFYAAGLFGYTLPIEHHLQRTCHHPKLQEQPEGYTQGKHQCSYSYTQGENNNAGSRLLHVPPFDRLCRQGAVGVLRFYP
ncbi:hypothetical protein BAE44_0019414 [Dichanthelium oligosanthes]|uniref:Uncharacterized protein n=1 Tax=Dichanthelium oligosanthes TaxID=888268 RepID=A0A1E5V337_9POAL|nr:hypothetical protein BAE44_0019414 [Dichanthelium oligosanthes]